MRYGITTVGLRRPRAWLLIALVCFCGCAARRPVASDARPVVIVVPGAAGDLALGGLVAGLRGHFQQSVHIEVFRWGAPAPMFLLNLQNQAIHDDAEQKLARLIAQRRAERPRVVMIVAHSAGCGVALGAMKRLSLPHVSRAVLLAPSVSPEYDLSASMRGVGGTMHVFHSSRDTFYLSWRTGTFGTYDNVRTRAAGNVGFANCPPNVAQHSYDTNWETLGNRGGHFDVLDRRFIRQIIAPLL